MPKAYATWTVLPHAPIEKLEDNLWRVEGSLPTVPLKRVMTIARLGDGGLVIHNPIALDAPCMAELEAFGRPAYLVVPNGWHRLDAKAFATRYPDARVLAPRGVRAKVEEVVAVGGELGELVLDPSVRLEPLAGSRDQECVMIVRSGGRTSVVLADAVFNMPDQRGVQGFILKHVMKSSGGPRVSRVGGLLLIKDKPAFAAQLERLATADLARVIVAHHETITDRPADALRRVASSVR